MEQNRWREIDALFEMVLDLQGDEREAFLGSLESELRPEVEHLLAADQAAQTFLEDRAATFLTKKAVPNEKAGSPELPRRIGPYKVLGVLGEGGMGRVLLASRADEQYQRLVAIKTLRTRLPGALREELLARFDLERQALAQLEHPNIARLYDAGRDEQGDPYLVIEHIDGLPIDQFCDEHRLDIAARLRLFLEVCQAVQSAHRNLLVHRDLKPSNILVTREGRPMLLDFGIAKLLDPARIAGEVLETRTGSRPMTPGYASPEQVKGEKITTTSDVYSLGVLLYELLSGRRPYRITSSLPHELERAICEVEPEKPSTAVFRDTSQNGAEGKFDPLAPKEIAYLRGTTATALARTLRGDLDTLLKVALRKDPERRYSSAEALAQDIQAFLEGKPLQARAPSGFYKLRKFASRHRFGVATAAILVLLLLSFVSALMVQAKQIRAERDKAETALAFLIEVFKASDPSRAQGEELKAREILDGAARRVEGELAGQPEIQATLMDAMGQVYFSLGIYAEARTLFEKALARREVELGGIHPESRQTRARLGRALRELGELEAARTQAEKVIADRGPHEPDDVAFAEELGDLAALDRLENKFDSAVELRKQAVAILETQSDDFKKRLEAKAYLTLALLEARRFDQLDPLVAMLKEQSSTLLAADGVNLELATSLYSVGDLLAQFGDFRAEALLQRSLEIRRHLLAPGHPAVLEAARTLAFFFFVEERFDEALTVCREAYDLALANLGPDHLDTITLQNDMAIAMAQDGNAVEALPLLLEVRDRFTEKFGDTSMQVALVWMSLGGLHRIAGHFAPAELHYQEARKRFLTLKNADLSAIDIAFGRLRRDQKRYEEAAQFFNRGLEARLVQMGEHDWRYAMFLGEYAEILVELGRYEESETSAFKSYNALREFYGPNTVMLKRPLKALLALYQKQGRSTDAERIKAALENGELRPEKLGA